MDTKEFDSKVLEIDLKIKEMDFERQQAEHKFMLEKINKYFPENERFAFEEDKVKLNIQKMEAARRNIELLLKLKEDYKDININQQINENLKVMQLINK